MKTAPSRSPQGRVEGIERWAALNGGWGGRGKKIEGGIERRLRKNLAIAPFCKAWSGGRGLGGGGRGNSEIGKRNFATQPSRKLLMTK